MPFQRNVLAKKEGPLVAKRDLLPLNTSPRVIHRWGKEDGRRRQNELERNRCKEKKACRRFSNRRRLGRLLKSMPTFAKCSERPSSISSCAPSRPYRLLS